MVWRRRDFFTESQQAGSPMLARSTSSTDVLNRNVNLSMPHLAHLVIPFSEAIKMAA